MNDVRANKGILVARKGFSAKAVKKAKRSGIDICTAHDIENIKDFVPKAPVVVHYLQFEFTSVGCSMQGGRGRKVDFMKFMIGNVAALDIFRSDLANLRYVPKVCTDTAALRRMHATAKKVKARGLPIDTLPYGEYLNIWKPDETAEIRYIDSEENIDAAVRDFDVTFMMRYDYYFGYLNDLPGSFALTSISTDTANLFFDTEQLHDFRRHFAQFGELRDVPVNEAVNLYCLSEIRFENMPAAQF